MRIERLHRGRWYNRNRVNELLFLLTGIDKKMVFDSVIEEL